MRQTIEKILLKPPLNVRKTTLDPYCTQLLCPGVDHHGPQKDYAPISQALSPKAQKWPGVPYDNNVHTALRAMLGRL